MFFNRLVNDERRCPPGCVGFANMFINEFPPANDIHELGNVHELEPTPGDIAKPFGETIDAIWFDPALVKPILDGTELEAANAWRRAAYGTPNDAAIAAVAEFEPEYDDCWRDSGLVPDDADIDDDEADDDGDDGEEEVEETEPEGEDDDRNDVISFV